MKEGIKIHAANFPFSILGAHLGLKLLRLSDVSGKAVDQESLSVVWGSHGLAQQLQHHILSRQTRHTDRLSHLWIEKPGTLEIRSRKLIFFHCELWHDVYSCKPLLVLKPLQVSAPFWHPIDQRWPLEWVWGLPCTVPNALTCLLAKELSLRITGHIMHWKTPSLTKRAAEISKWLNRLIVLSEQGLVSFLS